MSDKINRGDITNYDPVNGYVELNATFPESKNLWNKDFQPTKISERTWIFTIIFSELIYILLMKFWILPKYQPELKGGLIHGYIADDTKEIFEKKVD